MRRAAHRGGIGARAEDLEIAIDLLAVGVDDDAVPRRRQFERNADLPLAVGPAMMMTGS